MTNVASGIPEGWGDDLLAEFIDYARQHLLGTFANYPIKYRRLVALDESIYRLTSHEEVSEEPRAAVLAIHTSSSFRAAVQLAMSGQLAQGYMVLRGCLESALYAHLISENVEGWNVWAKRGDCASSRNACAKFFAKGQLVESIAKRSLSLSVQAGELYERCIELGAHPNEMSIAMTMEAERQPDGGLTVRHSVISGDTEPFHLALQSASDVGIVVVQILNITFPERAATLRRLDLA